MPSATKRFQGQLTEDAREKSERQKVLTVKQCLKNSLEREDQRIAEMTARDGQTGSSSGSKISTTTPGSKEPGAISDASLIERLIYATF
ncbi:hypothetical protein BOTCAL_0116g00060 [Botryotinia calthae]|uniref:Uncharacterized protein n=1 Tax=Botryotinia calthae TaxID=38488 RepID=A0A4Y8D774_9HELO|nr:hypothetical protein BOTCAL_0116g00060 [Botryotinia calthae]